MLRREIEKRIREKRNKFGGFYTVKDFIDLGQRQSVIKIIRDLDMKQVYKDIYTNRSNEVSVHNFIKAISRNNNWRIIRKEPTFHYSFIYTPMNCTSGKDFSIYFSKNILTRINLEHEKILKNNIPDYIARFVSNIRKLRPVFKNEDYYWRFIKNEKVKYTEQQKKRILKETQYITICSEFEIIKEICQ